MNVAVGLRVRHGRDSRGWTREAFAERCGLSASFISEIERGNRSMSVDTLCKLAHALDVSTDSLLGLTRDGRYDYIAKRMTQLPENVAGHLENVIREFIDCYGG